MGPAVVAFGRTWQVIYFPTLKQRAYGRRYVLCWHGRSSISSSSKRAYCKAFGRKVSYDDCIDCPKKSAVKYAMSTRLEHGHGLLRRVTKLTLVKQYKEEQL